MQTEQQHQLAFTAAATLLSASCCFIQEEDFNVHIAGLPIEHATTAAGAPATGVTNAPANASSSSNSRAGSTAATAAAAAAVASAKSDKVCAALSQAIDGQDVLLKQWQQQQGGSSGGSNVAAVATAIAARLQFRRQLLQGIIKLKRKQKQVCGELVWLLWDFWGARRGVYRDGIQQGYRTRMQKRRHRLAFLGV